jgi:hypothetical protein
MFRRRGPRALASFLVFLGVLPHLLASDCNRNGTSDTADIASGTSEDCNSDQMPDECEIAPLEFATEGAALLPDKSPSIPVLADLDGDGLEDLVTANDDSTVSVLLNREDGVFKAARHFETSQGIWSLAAADLDGDNDLDLLAAVFSSVEVLWNDGGGSLSAPVPLLTEGSTVFAAAADFNSDGVPDVVAASLSRSTLSLLESHGGGNFGLVVPVEVGSAPNWATAADLDGDGDLDLAVTHRRSSKFSTVLRQADGTFSAPTDNDSGGNRPSSLTTGDFDQDGDLDLIATTADQVSLIANQGAATFAPPAFLAGKSTTSTAADFDGDGDLDLALGVSESRTLSVLTYRATGQFHATALVIVAADLRRLAAADLDQDGDQDLVATQKRPDDVSVFWNGEQIEVAVEASATVAINSEPHSATLGDVDGDCNLDVLTSNGSCLSVSVLRGTGLQTIEAPRTYGVFDSAHLNSIISGDFDQDGNVDMVAADSNKNRLHLLLNQGDGTFGPVSVLLTKSSAFMVTTADLNTDDRLDLITAHPPNNSVSIFLNAGGGAFQERVDLAVGSAPRAVAVSDLDQDGDLDLVVPNATSQDVSLLWNQGDGAFAPPVNLPVLGAPFYATVGDFDGDGDQDLATANQSSGDVSVYLGGGNGTFVGPASFALERLPYSVITADENADGQLDLITANEQTDSISILRGNGDGTFQEPVHRAAGAGPRFVLAGDLDGDGDTDLVSANRLSQNVTLFFNDAPALVQESLEEICTGLDLHKVSAGTERRNSFRRRTGYVYPLADDSLFPNMLYANATLFPSVREFLRSRYPERFPSDEEFESLVGQRNTRRYFVGNLGPLRQPSNPLTPGVVYAFSVFVPSSDPVEQATLEEVRSVYAGLRRTFHLNPLGYFPETPSQREIAANWTDVGFPILGLTTSGRPFRRGDVNADGLLNITDAVFLASFLFRNGPLPACLKSGDANDDDSLNITDVVSLLSYLIRNGAALAEPLRSCGLDPTLDELSCDRDSPCL